MNDDQKMQMILKQSYKDPVKFAYYFLRNEA